MKKSLMILALAGLSYGAFAQATPAKKPAMATKKTMKADTTVKKAKTVKKVKAAKKKA